MLRWEDCVKRDMKNTGEKGDMKKKTGDRGGWETLADKAVKKLQAAPHPWSREKEEDGEKRLNSGANTSLRPLVTVWITSFVMGGKCWRVRKYLLIIMCHTICTTSLNKTLEMEKAEE